MKTVVTITDLTRMNGDRVCIAAYTDRHECIRPVFRVGHLTEQWLQTNNDVVIQPFARVEFDLLQKRGLRPHTEDWVVDHRYRVSHGLLPAPQRKALLAQLDDGHIRNIFGAAVHQGPGWYVQQGDGLRSLGTVQLKHVHRVYHHLNDAGYWEYQLAFTDQSGEQFRLSVTDLAFRAYLDCLRTKEHMRPDRIAAFVTERLVDSEVFLRIGLARGWKKYPDRCYLQITGIYVFPDYLHGRCFADLREVNPPKRRSVVREDDAELPF